jgi:hypothetical protein
MIGGTMNTEKGSSLSRSLVTAVVLASATGAYFLAGSLRSGSHVPVVNTHAEDGPSDPNYNPFGQAHGTHLMAYILTSSDCGWSRVPSQMKAIREVRPKLRSIYGSSYADVAVVGVALDKSLVVGLSFLAELAGGRTDDSFDQVIVGGSWLNEQIVRFVWREGLVEAATPQILVMERPVMTDAYVSTHKLGVGSDRVVAQMTGDQSINDWIAKGMPLDRKAADAQANAGTKLPPFVPQSAS